MPQADKYRDRTVPLEFLESETMEEVPYSDRLTLVLIETGTVKLSINGDGAVLNSPCLMFISENDSINIIEKNSFSAKSFSFSPTFINSTLTFEALRENRFTNIEDEHDRNALMKFLCKGAVYKGYLEIADGSAYLQLKQWLECVGRELYAQSDNMWTCRIRRWLLQILYLADDMYACPDAALQERSPADIAAEYIHINYRNDITLPLLCKISGTNRTTLNQQFKKKFGVTAVEYLVNHRIKMACEILAHTNLTMGEIAEATGFKYDTYFIKQFTKRKGMSPTDYRNDVRERAPGLSNKKSCQINNK